MTTTKETLHAKLMELMRDGLEFGDCIVAFGEDSQQNPYVAAAKNLVAGDEGSCEVDDVTIVSCPGKGGDAGAYVMAWLWVSDEEAGVCRGVKLPEKIDEIDLDELVLNAAETLVSEINNEGVLAQVAACSVDSANGILDLDSLVWATICDKASKANNEGYTGQIEFLLYECKWGVRDVEARLAEM